MSAVAGDVAVVSAMTRVKTEISEDEDARKLSALSLKALLTRVSQSESSSYVDALLQKLANEGVDAAWQLKELSIEMIEKKLGPNQNFNLRDPGDVIRIRNVMTESCRRHSNSSQPRSREHSNGHNERHDGKKGSGESYHGQWRRDRSRSRSPWRRRNYQEEGPIGGRRGKGKSKGAKGNRWKGKSKGVKDDHFGKTRKEDADAPPPALWKAAEEGDVDTVRRLLEDQSLDVDEPHQHWTPLMKSAEEGHAEIVQLLLDRLADVKAANRKGRTALSFAAAPSMKRSSTEGHLFVLRLLVERGADLRCEDERGMTALDHAKREGRDDIVKCLSLIHI